jgi:hypothetical protein
MPCRAGALDTDVPRLVRAGPRCPYGEIAPAPAAPPRSVTAEEVAAAKAATLPAFKAAWARLVERGRPLAARWAEGRDPAVGAELEAVGREMGLRMALACLWNLEGVFMPFMGTRSDGCEGLLSPGADGRIDAGEEHWRRLVHGNPFTREQVGGPGQGAAAPAGRRAGVAGRLVRVARHDGTQPHPGRDPFCPPPLPNAPRA